MEYTSNYDSDISICTVYVTGTYKRLEDSTILKHFACNFYKKKGCRNFLFDMTKAKIESSTFGTFESGNPPDELSGTLRNLKVAILFSEITEDDKFFETVAVNRGYRMQIFAKIEEAIEWLNKKR